MTLRRLPLALVLCLAGLAAHAQQATLQTIEPPRSDTGRAYAETAAKGGVSSNIDYSPAYDPNAKRA